MTASPTHRSILGPPARCPGFITTLVLRCAQGDEKALGALFDLFAPVVIRVCGDRCHSRDADVLVVEAFCRVWARASAYDPATRDVVSWILEQVRDVPRRSPTVLAVDPGDRFGK